VIITAAFLLLTGAAGFAQTCPQKPTDLVKPVLAGIVQDGARDIHFEWISTARQNGESWRITHSVCNLSHSSLILTWGKANISANGFAPIPPGYPIMISHTLASEPVADGSPIQYGYGKYIADAETYQKPVKEQKLTNLSSSIFGFVENRIPDTKNLPQNPKVWNVQTFFEVDKRADGYTFRPSVKNRESSELLMAISSSQNENFVKALSAKGVEVTTRAISWESDRVGGVAQVSSKRQYVVFAISDAVKVSGGLVVPSTGDDIEIADVALLTKNFVPVMFGNLSIFK
jgi:hypothetical protein